MLERDNLKMDVINVFAMNADNEKAKGSFAFDGDCFITKSFDENAEQYDKILSESSEKDYKPPFWLTLGYKVGWAATIVHMVLFFIYDAAFPESSSIFSDLPIVAVTAIVSCFLWVSCAVAGVVKRRDYEKENKAREGEDERRLKLFYKKLGVPEGANNIDVLCGIYRIDKKGKRKNAMASDFMSLDMKAYTDGESFMLADISTIYTFPLENICALKKTDRRVCMVGWNKTESYRDEKYREYKINGDNKGNVYFKGVASLQIKKDRTLYEILFPAYEINTLIKLTGLTPQGE